MVVRNLEPAAVTGAVAADVAHVLAELIENGLSFSPPEQSVEVKGRLTTAGYTLAITDNGLGMAAEDVERANRRLAGKESFTVAPVPLPRALRGRPPGQPPRRRRRAAGQPGRRHHRPHRRADGPARRRRARPHAGQGARAPSPSPSPSSPVRWPPAVSTETTASGLPRRGDRGRPLAGRRRRPSRRARRAAPTPTPRRRARAAPLAGAGPASAAPLRRRRSHRPAPAPLPADAASAASPVTPTGPSMFSVAAQQARRGRAPTATGTRRRTPADGTGGRPPVASPAGCPAPSGPTPSIANRAPEPARRRAGPRRTPEDVYSFLSNFQSGVARGRADAASDDAPTSQEDGR